MPNGEAERPIDPQAVRSAELRMLAPRDERRMREILEAVCDPTRVKILRALGDTRLAAGDLARVIGRSPAATSQHLRVLRDSGAVTTSRQGNIVRYALSPDVTGTILDEIGHAFDRLEQDAQTG